MLVSTYRSTWHKNPEHQCHPHHCEKLKSSIHELVGSQSLCGGHVLCLRVVMRRKFSIFYCIRYNSELLTLHVHEENAGNLKNVMYKPHVI